MIFSRYQVFRACLIAFLCGVAVSQNGIGDFFTAYELCLFFCVAIILARKNERVRQGSIVALCFALGLGRTFFGGGVSIFAPAHTPFSFSGHISADPSFKGGYQILTVAAVDGDNTSHGIMNIVLPTFPVYYIDQDIVGTCSSLKKEKKSGRVPTCANATISRQPENVVSLRSTLARMRDFFGDAIQTGMASPQADLLKGLLVGAHGSFSPDIAAAFRTSGLSHIVAVSGSNISLVIAGLWSILSRSRIRRKNVFWCMGLGVVLFVMLTGASGATIRAGVMGMVVLCAQYMGRLARSVSALMITAVCMVAIEPTLLIANIGFQLSCLATLGLIVCSPHLESRLPAVLSWGGIREIIAQTASAMMFTAPLIVAAFQTFSLVGFFANIFLVPLVSPIMTIGFAWSIVAVVSFAITHGSSFSFQPAVAALGLPVYGFLSVIIHGALFFASLPFATIHFDPGAWTPFFLTTWYTILAVFVWRMKQIDALDYTLK